MWGLRLFPRAGDAEEEALGHALSGVPARVRAAFVLQRLDGLSAAAACAVLAGAGVGEPDAALRAADRIGRSAGPAVAMPSHSREFDACSVQARPTDLLRRRTRCRLTVLTIAMAVLTSGLVTAVETRHDQPSPSAPTASTSKASADQLIRVSSEAWADTSRVDFTAWPARGTRTDDAALLTTALASWAQPAPGTRVNVSPNTRAAPPGGHPQLLFAGDVDGRVVVVFHEGQRLIRYTESVSGAHRPTLDIARVDNADVTTSAAVVVSRSSGRVRFLTAPWIVEVRQLDLARSDSPGRALKVSDDSITAPVRDVASGTDSCDQRPALQLRSSTKIVEKHAFVVADLGGLTPAHLSYTPLPGDGAPSRQPREATSEAAAASWSRVACSLRDLRSPAVSSLNVWDFAEQELPENGGRAVWSCTRASTWRGPGHILVHWAPASPDSKRAKVVARAQSTAACSRFGQHVVASTRWRADNGHSYLLAAGSRNVTSISVTGDITTTRGRTLAVRAKTADKVTVRARLADGSALTEAGNN
ncbi:hypothetical protein ACIBKX_09070 [Streptomyces sp. NPDC050658]|uniref:hypothetical protein n=1 Tax=unclassified Streptomyces TaxID=2593676 RepID=UPI0034155148